MRKLIGLGVTVVVAVLASAVPASAEKPAKGCPASPSGFVAVSVDWSWEPGDPVPDSSDPEADYAWYAGAQGVLAEGWASLDEFAEAFLGEGATAADLYWFALQGWRSIDENQDGLICMQPYPEASPHPAYLFNFVDANAAAKD